MFAEPVLASRIYIFETFDAPFVTKVQLVDQDGYSTTTVFSGTDSTACGSALEVIVAAAEVPVQRVMIRTHSTGYGEIDAVQLCGVPTPYPPVPPPMTPQPISPPATPPPCDAELEIVLVIDNSGSVAGQRPNVLEFARTIIRYFTVGPSAAQIGYVEFDTTAYTLSELTPDLGAVMSAIDNAPPTGSGTFLSGGLELGQTVSCSRVPQVVYTLSLVQSYPSSGTYIHILAGLKRAEPHTL